MALPQGWRERVMSTLWWIDWWKQKPAGERGREERFKSKPPCKVVSEISPSPEQSGMFLIVFISLVQGDVAKAEGHSKGRVALCRWSIENLNKCGGGTLVSWWRNMSAGFFLACFIASRMKRIGLPVFPLCRSQAIVFNQLWLLSPQWSDSKTEVGLELSPSPGSRNTRQMEKTRAIWLIF